MKKTQQQKVRITELVNALKLTDKIHLRDAAVILNVSEMTIRRDLNSESEPLVLLGGYIVNNQKITETNSRYFVSDQQDKHVNEKKTIAELAARLVVENDTIFFDCGTTIPLTISAIDNDINFTGICYSLNAFIALQSKPNCRVILCGGNYNPNNAIFTSVTRFSELDNICPNKTFISAAGIDLQKGVTCFNFDELLMKQKALDRSNHCILLIDSSKFNEIRPAFISHITQFDSVITDKAPNQPFVDYFNKNKIELKYNPHTKINKIY